MCPSQNGRTCVYCRRKPVAPEWRPFCGERCKVLDLAQWADASYGIAGEAACAAEATDNLTPET